jgi:hypothetical protein
MSVSLPLNQKAMFQKIVSEAGIARKERQECLRRCFEKKCAQHVNVIQYHRLREDRFAVSQQKVIDR